MATLDIAKLFADVKAGKITQEAAAAMIEAAQADAVKAAQAKASALRIKHSEKGCVSVYGLNARFPTSLYADQWARLGDYLPTVLKYCEDNRAELDALGAAHKTAAKAAKATSKPDAAAMLASLEK